MPSSPKIASRTPSPERRSPDSANVLIDGSALFLGARGLYEGRQLDYRALIDVLVNQIPGLEPPTGASRPRWVMWTSASPQNQGQSRFLDFAENDLRWEVRRFSPADSYMVEPATVLGLSSEGRAASRLVRFDASIAFAIGRLAELHRIVLVSDSFALADPLIRTANIVTEPARRPVLAFFGRALDARWQRVLRTEGNFAPEFIDFDDFEERLFGSQPPPRPATARGETMVF